MVSDEEVKQAQEALTSPRARRPSITREELLSTGSTLLNLALTGYARGGFSPGGYFYYVGDSGSGKTFFCLTCFAEAARHPKFKDYDLIYDDVENGALMDFEKFFGKAVAEKACAPGYDAKGKPIYSDFIDDFYFRLIERLENVKKKKENKFIWVLDSMDALRSIAAEAKHKTNAKKREDGDKLEGSYGDGKAKQNSERLRTVVDLLEDTGCILIIISQTRDNFDAGMYGDPSTRAGGRALRFYASAEIWTTATDIKTEVAGKTRPVGINTRLRIKKNRLSGKNWTVVVPMYWSHGIDDIGACVAFLRDEGVIKGNSSGHYQIPIVDGSVLKVHGEANIIPFIEENDLENDIIDLTEKVWADIEAQCSVKRKKRYE